MYSTDWCWMSSFWSFLLELQDSRAHLNWSSIKILSPLLRAASSLIFFWMGTPALFLGLWCWNFWGRVKSSCSFFHKDTLFWGWFRSQDFGNTLVPPFTFDWSCPLKQNLTKLCVRIKYLAWREELCKVLSNLPDTPTRGRSFSSLQTVWEAFFTD